jgi:hypothetical protein
MRTAYQVNNKGFSVLKKKTAAVLLAALAAVCAAPAQASNGLGIDVIRLIDENQADGMANLYWQHRLAGGGALILGYSSGDNLNIVDFAYKHYLGRYADSLFLQAGLGYYDGRDDDDLGFVGSLGYERRLGKHLVASGSVRMIAGVDEAVARQGAMPLFQPTLGLMLTF